MKRYKFLIEMEQCRESRIDATFFSHLIRTSEYALSVQASEYTYCTPRRNLDDLTDYTHMEMAVMYSDNNGYDYDFVDASRHFLDFPRRDELEQFFEGSVYAYVPVDLIEDLFLHMKKMTK